MVQRLQVKASQIGKILTNLEREGHMSGGHSMTDSHHSNSSSIGPPVKKPHLKIGTIPPFNANKIRKSPSVDNNNKSEKTSTTASSTPSTAAIKEEKEEVKQKLIENAMQDLKAEE